jgi:ribonucleoside-diphosphate reductase subunit M2
MTESPVKKINFGTAEKENLPHPMPVPVDDLELKKPAVEVVEEQEKPNIAPTIKPCEADEPLLQENPHRFVLFPIKYHEVNLFHASSRVTCIVSRV